MNSIAYAFALRHRITAFLEKRSIPDILQPGGALWNKLVLFLETADPVQLRYVGHEWRKLVEYTEQIARATGSVCPVFDMLHLIGKLTATAWPCHCTDTVGNDPT